MVADICYSKCSGPLAWWPCCLPKNSVSIFSYRWFIFTHSFAHAIISFMWNHKTLESEQKNTVLCRKSQEKGFGVELTTLTYTEAVWDEALPVSMSIKPSLQLVSHVRMESIILECCWAVLNSEPCLSLLLCSDRWQRRMNSDGQGASLKQLMWSVRLLPKKPREGTREERRERNTKRKWNNNEQHIAHAVLFPQLESTHTTSQENICLQKDKHIGCQF